MIDAERDRTVTGRFEVRLIIRRDVLRRDILPFELVPHPTTTDHRHCQIGPAKPAIFHFSNAASEGFS